MTGKFIATITSLLLIILLMGMTGCSHSSQQTGDTASLFDTMIHSDDSISLTHELGDFAQRLKLQTGLYVLEDGGGSLIARAWLCEHAEKSIDIQYFIFSTDNVGLIACDYLVRAADRGVKVRILVDDILVDADIEDILMMDSHENIEIKIYNPGVNVGKNLFGKIKKFTTDFRSANLRMHNKTFIVDKQIVITGGRNIADEYFDYDHEYNFRDRDVLLLGKIMPSVNHSFEAFWNAPLSVPISSLTDKQILHPNDPSRFDKLHQYASNPENFWPQIRQKISDFKSVIQTIKTNEVLTWVDSVVFISDTPGKNDGTNGLGGGGATTDALINLIQNAQNSIHIQSPYLITTDLGKELFRNAVTRGVKVRVLTNSLASTDNLEAFASYQSDRKELLKTGIRIFEFRPDAAERFRIMTGDLQEKLNYQPIFGLHAKTMVIDGFITVIGTFNFDPRSANLNTECVVIIHSKEVADKVMRGIEIEFLPENSWEISSEWNPDSKVKRVKRLKTWTRKALPKDIL